MTRGTRWFCISIALIVLAVLPALALCEGPPANMSPPRTYPQGTP